MSNLPDNVTDKMIDDYFGDDGECCKRCDYYWSDGTCFKKECALEKEYTDEEYDKLTDDEIYNLCKVDPSDWCNKWEPIWNDDD